MSYAISRTLKPVYKTSIYELLADGTPITVTTDLCGSYRAAIWSTVKTKEELGIEDTHLIHRGDDFPVNPKIGQVFVRDGIMYEYVGDEEKESINTDENR